MNIPVTFPNQTRVQVEAQKHAHNPKHKSLYLGPRAIEHTS